MIIVQWGVMSGGNGPTNEASAKINIASETEAWDNSRIRYDDRIFGRGMKNIAELIMAKDDEDEGEPAIRRSLLSRNGWKDHLMLWMIPVKFCDELEKLSKLEAQHIDVCTYIGFCHDHPMVNRVGKILYEENIEDDLLERTY